MVRQRECVTPGPEPPPVSIMPRYLDLHDSSGTSDNGGSSAQVAPPATPPGVPRVIPCDGSIITSCWELRNELRSRIGGAMRVKGVQPRVGVKFTLHAVPFAAHGVFVERGWLERGGCMRRKLGVETVKLEALDSQML